MKDEEKSEDRLIGELVKLCRRITEIRPLETKWKDAGPPLQITHPQYLDIIEFLPDATFVIDRERKVIAWNRAIEEMTGVSKEDVFGKGEHAYACPFYGEPRPILIDLVLSDDAEFAQKYSFVEKVGNTIFGEVFAPVMYGGKGAYLWGKASPLFDGENNLIGAIESIRDITEWKQAEEALRKSEEKYRELVENANSIILRMDVEGNITFFNEFAQRFFGYTEEEILGRNVIGRIVPERDAAGRDMVSMIRELARHPEKYSNNENENMRRNGERVWVAWTNRALQDDSGRFSELLCVGNDITERKRAEESLRESEQRFRMLIETMNEGVGVQDERGLLTYVNGKLCEMMGYSRDEILGRRVSDFISESSRSVYEEGVMTRRLGRRASYEVEAVAKDGRKVPVIVSSSPVVDDKGSFAGVVAAVTDITIRKQAEKKLRESEEKYRMIFKNSPLGIFHFDPNGVITACNDNIVKIWGSSKNKLIGFNLLTSLKSRKMRAAVSACLSGKPGIYEGNYVSVTGGKITYTKADYGPILSEDGTVLGGIGIIEDISERKQAEEALLESERELRFLSSQLLKTQEQERKKIAGELHDGIGSSLSAIKFSLEETLKQMKRRTAKPESLLAAIAMTQHAIEESRRIMNDLRPSLLDDLGIVVTTRWFCRQFQSVYENIALEKEIELEERDVPEFLKIVIFRITQEALHNVAKHSGATAVKLSIAKRGGLIDLAIRDNGVGFDLPSVLSREGLGKGFGIASMKERTELAGGTFSVESTHGVGTTIRAVWPIGGRKA